MQVYTFPLLFQKPSGPWKSSVHSSGTTVSQRLEGFFVCWFGLGEFFYWSTAGLQCCMVSDVQQSDPVIYKMLQKTQTFWPTQYIYSDTHTHTHTHIYIYIIFHCQLLQDTEYSSLYYTGELCCSFILCILVCNGTPLQYSCLENPMDGGAW